MMPSSSPALRDLPAERMAQVPVQYIDGHAFHIAPVALHALRDRLHEHREERGERPLSLARLHAVWHRPFHFVEHTRGKPVRYRSKQPVNASEMLIERLPVDIRLLRDGAHRDALERSCDKQPLECGNDEASAPHRTPVHAVRPSHAPDLWNNPRNALFVAYPHILFHI